jgi:uncharacterized protein YndB with AHSA1/START domain
MIDTNPLTGTERAVGHRRIAAGEARTALIRRRYHATVEDVWEACTDPVRLSRWFPKVSGDLRVGGRFSIEGNASGVELADQLGRAWAALVEASRTGGAGA